MNQDQRDRLAVIEEDTTGGPPCAWPALGTGDVDIEWYEDGREFVSTLIKKLKDAPDDYDVEPELCLLERTLFYLWREKSKEGIAIEKTVSRMEKRALKSSVREMREASTKGVRKANKDRTNTATRRWAPFQRLWRLYVHHGLGPDTARTAVSKKMKSRGRWWGKGDEPSKSSLKTWLK